MRRLPFPHGYGTRGVDWPVLITDDGGTVPALLAISVPDAPEPGASVRVTHRGRHISGRGMPSLDAALIDLAAALAPAYLRACITCRLSTPGPVETMSSETGLDMGRWCQRTPEREPVLDTHWCDRYERIGSPR